MTRIARIATTSLATLEATQPPYNLRSPDPADTVHRAAELLTAAGACGADLVCLPETFAVSGLTGQERTAYAEPIPGTTFDLIADVARRNSMYVAAGFLCTADDGTVRNVATLIDRHGELVGTYAKMLPTAGELDCGIGAGREAPVFDTDFGKVALAICFDINVPNLWQRFAADEADVVCWLSAYEGGFPLRSFAWQHQYLVVSSVQSYTSRIIGLMGNELARTSRWARLAWVDVDLDQQLFHTDGNADKLVALQTSVGDKAEVYLPTEEHMFTIGSSSPDFDVQRDAVGQFRLIPYSLYISDSMRAVNLDPRHEVSVTHTADN